MRELAGGDHAVALFNLGTEPATISFRWRDLGIQKAPRGARDLWTHRDIKLDSEYSTEVAGHGVALLRIH